MCGPLQKTMEGCFSFIFWNEFYTLTFLIASFNLASNEWICIP